MHLGARADPGCFGAKTLAMQRACQMAGIGPTDVGLAEVYDAYAGAQLQAVEALGLSDRLIADLTEGRLRQDVPVALNRLATEYDHVLICGPVFPHEVAGFSGGAKYLFPGIAAPEIIHFTHWLGALVTSYAVIGECVPSATR
jgi:nickel-dependent lactate racemase